MMQFHKIMYPVFARVGVKLITRNMAQGGLGTIQAGMGSGAIYGNDVDLLLWDSGKCESISCWDIEPDRSYIHYDWAVAGTDSMLWNWF